MNDSEIDGFQPSAGFLQVISNVTGAYVEAITDASVGIQLILQITSSLLQYRISASSHASAVHARSMMLAGAVRVRSCLQSTRITN